MKTTGRARPRDDSREDSTTASRVRDAKACPACTAPVGIWCYEPAGKPVPGLVHRERVLAYSYTRRGPGRPRKGEPLSVTIAGRLTEAEADALDARRGSQTRWEAIRDAARKAGLLG